MTTARVSASKRASSTMPASSSAMSTHSVASDTPASRRDKVSNWPTNWFILSLSRSTRCRQSSIRAGCWRARPIAACNRASGERISWETSWSRRFWPSTRRCRRSVMRSKSRPRSANSSRRPCIPGATRASRSPSATRSKPLRNWRMGRAKYQARPAAQNTLASRPAITGKTGTCIHGAPPGPPHCGRPSGASDPGSGPKRGGGCRSKPSSGGGGRRWCLSRPSSPGGGPSLPLRRSAALFRSTQNSMPVPSTAAIWASQMNRKNFQNSRPMLFADQLVTLPVNRLDAGATVKQGAKFAPDAGKVDVDAAVEADQRPTHRLLRQGGLADRPTGAAGQHLQEVEFGTGQIDRRAAPLDPPQFRKNRQRADRNRCIGVASRLGAPQDGPQARGKFARQAGLGYVIVGPEFEPDDAIHVIARGGQHQNRHTARGADTAQGLDTAQPGHHHVEHDDAVISRQCRIDTALAIMDGGGCKAVQIEVIAQHSGKLDIVVDQQDGGHGVLRLFGKRR